MLTPPKKYSAKVDIIIRSAQEQIIALINRPVLLRAYEPPFPLETIMSVVCNKLEVAEADVIGVSRKEKIKDARHIASYLAHSTGCYHSSEIGRWLNYDDHTGATHACKRIKDLLGIGDPTITHKLALCKSALYNQQPLTDKP